MSHKSGVELLEMFAAGQQRPTRTLTAALKRVIKQLQGTYSITQVKYYKRESLS